MNLEEVYGRLPVVTQNLACSIEGLRIQRTRFGGAFLHFLNSAEARTTWPRTEIDEFRNEKLRQFVRHCYETVPFYQRRFRELGLRPEDFHTLNDLQRLPILTKEEVQTHYLDLLSQVVPHGERNIAHTSGTTGGGLRFATTLQATQEQWATWWRYRRWHGLQLGTWCGYFGGRSVVPLTQEQPPFWRYNRPGKQILFSAYHMSSDNLDAYIVELRHKRPPWLHGYPSLLALLATHLLERDEDLGYAVQWVTTGAENLLPQQIELIQSAIGVRPIQHYGMAEAVANISQCEHGRLHVDEDFAAVEFIPNPNGPGHKVIGTNFTNLATPLLRYDVQDLVTLDNTECPCGRPGRTVASIDGRAEDYVVLKNGARLGRMDHVFKDLVNIREAQIVQEQVGEIVVRIVAGDHFGPQDEANLLAELRKRVGDDTVIAIDYVDSLPRGKTGKLRFVISNLAEGQLTHK